MLAYAFRYHLMNADRRAVAPLAVALTDTPSEFLTSPAHSRLELRADRTESPVQLAGHLETDFLNPTPGGAPSLCVTSHPNRARKEAAGRCRNHRDVLPYPRSSD